jgi:hypothetical protein
MQQTVLEKNCADGNRRQAGYELLKSLGKYDFKQMRSQKSFTALLQHFI